MSPEAQNQFMKQITSGRWILTVMSGVCLVILTVSLVVKGEEHSISGEALVSIISMVFVSYFNRKRNGDG